MQAVVGYHRPESLEEALSLLNRVSPRSVVLAGGTSLNAAELSEPVEMIDLQAIGLDGIRTDGLVVEIGAMVRLFALTAHQAVPELVRLLARREAPSTLRNVATIGGTIATGDPDSELLAGCLVYEGQVTVARVGGVVENVALAGLLNDRSILLGSIITALRIDADGIGAAERTGRTPSDSSIVAAIGRRAPTGGIRLALTGMASTPILVEPAEVAALNPPGDFRGSSEYRVWAMLRSTR
jgi:carbon-monoxide dehydrogenase medium subunit